MASCLPNFIFFVLCTFKKFSIMYVCEKLKLNKFQLVRLPKPSVLFGRFGNQVVPDSAYTGDEAMSAYQSKIDVCSQQMDDYRKFAESESEAQS